MKAEELITLEVMYILAEFAELGVELYAQDGELCVSEEIPPALWARVKRFRPELLET